jgi:hypothetical protein
VGQDEASKRHHYRNTNVMGYFKKTRLIKNILILTLLFSASCGQPKDTKVPANNNSIAQVTKVEQEQQIENALTFVNSYVENCNRMKESIGVVEWTNSNELTTLGFKTELKRLVDEAYKLEPEIGLDADPIFDAQDYPDKGFELDSFDDKTNYIVVKGKDRPDFKLTIKMISKNNNWLVDGCGIINVPIDKRSAR